MSSEKKSGQGNPPSIARGKQSRRKLLKTMAAGSGAVIAGKSMPEQWTKPVINSVLLPGHAVTSCNITGTMTAYAPRDSPALGNPIAIPGSVTYYSVSGDSATEVVPQISVTPGITDTFNLTTNFSPPVTDFSGTSQNLAPDPANGTFAFEDIFASDVFDSRTQTTTLTPDNPGLCGGPLVVTITFNTAPDPG